jgi:hypothetical protein
MSDTPINQFLITYDIARKQAHVDEFGEDTERALDAYSAAERRHRGDEHIEVVLLGSDSLETLKRTHGRYFGLGDDHADEIVRRDLEARGLLAPARRG